MGLCAPWAGIYLHKYKLVELVMIALNPINALMITSEIIKTITLANNSHKPAGEANTYVQLVYVPLTIFLHTRVQVSVSMNTFSISMIHTSQQSTK